MKVGFFGLGRMGSGMAGQILGAGHELKAYDVIPEATAALAKKGAEVASSVAEACKGSDVVISMLTSDEILESVTISDGGIRDSLDAGAIHLVMGTHGVKVVHVLDEVHKESDQILVAAPVLGRPDLAATGQLGIVPAGPAEAVAKCKPLFDAMGKGTFDAGLRPEAANAIKLTNNFVLGCAIEAMAEAFSLVRKYDVKPEVMFEVMTGGLFAAPAYQVYGKIMVDESWDAPGFPTILGLKDANLVMEAADVARVPLPSVNVYRDRILSAVAHGDGDRDWAVLALEQARACGLD